MSTPINMSEVTRLTRHGRLKEAMALLRQGLAGLPVRTGPADAGQPDQPLLPAPAAPWAAMPAAVAGLARTVTRRPKAGATAAGPLPAGASFDRHTYAGPAGSREYKLYVPAGGDGRPRPLVVMLHGCTQSPEDFAAGTRMNAVADESGALVAYPGQPASANASKCWNWFNAGDQQRDRGEPAVIAGLTREIMAAHAVDPTRVFIAGLSAGGATAAIMAATYPDLYAAVGVHSGLACGAAKDMSSAFAAMRHGAAPQGGAPEAGASRPPVRTIVFHGDADTTVNPVNGDQVAARVARARTLSEIVEDGRAPGGIAYTKTARADAAGRTVLEHWVLHGAGHAWSGGSPAGSYTDPRGPDASREMMRFFLETGERVS